MKSVLRTLLTLIAALGLATAATAQTMPPRKGGVQPKPRVTATTTNVGVKDGLSMKGGRVMLTELGISNPLTADKKLVNGTTISPTGLVTSSTGTTTQMAEGDMVSLSGRVTSRSSIVEADSLLKIKQYDLIHPGKRERDAKVKAEKDKIKAERDAAKAKMAKEKEERAKKGKK